MSQGHKALRLSKSLWKMMLGKLQAGSKPQGVQCRDVQYQPHQMLQSTLHLLLVSAIALVITPALSACSATQSNQTQGRFDAVIGFCMTTFGMPVAKSNTVFLVNCLFVRANSSSPVTFFLKITLAMKLAPMLQGFQIV